MDLDRLNELEFEKSSKWRKLVLVVTLSMWWNFLIVVQCYATFFMCTYSLAFDTVGFLELTRFIFDLFYFIDVICTITYKTQPKLQKLRYVNVRGWFFIFLDLISLLPLELVYEVHNQTDPRKLATDMTFMQLRLLRVYRLFQLESMFEIKVRKGTQYAMLIIVQFTSKVLLISHILCCVWVNIEKTVNCDPRTVNCFVWYETNMANLVILNWSGPKIMFNSDWEHVVVTIGIFFGFILIYTYFYPYVLYISMILNQKRALYYDTYGKLQRFVRNMVKTGHLKKKIMHYFHDIWKTDREDSNMDLLMKNIPLALKKEIFTDIYWEAFRHSDLFRDVSRNCKRTLSLRMETMYYNAGDVIYKKGQSKQRMIYLVRGIIQIMAEENEKSPVMSFSSGTVFGEVPLFIHCTSQAILMCKSKCEVQSMKIRDVAQVIRDYPKDKAIVFANFSRRMKLARYAQWRKQRFRKEQLEGSGIDSSTAMEDCIKWLKAQWKSVWEVHHRHRQVIKAKEEGTRLPTFRRMSFPEVKIEFISNFLDLFVLSDVFEEKEDVVCLSTKFPWSIDPNSHFLHSWFYITTFTAVYACMMYPFCTAWLIRFPWFVYISSFIVTLVFQVDFFLKIFTAIKTKNRIVTNFSSVMRYQLQQPAFYADIIAAMPYQIYIMAVVDTKKSDSFEMGFILHFCLLKSYMFVGTKKVLNEHMEMMSLLKNTFIGFLLMYWLAEALQLVGVRNIFGKDVDDWIERFLADRVNAEILRQYYVAIFLALATAFRIPDFTMYSDNDAMVICLFIAKFSFFFVLCFFFGDYFGVHTVKIYSHETFNVLINRIQEFVESVYIPPKVSKRLVQTVKFQWKYDHADYLSSRVCVLKSLPYSLRFQIYKESTFKIIQTSFMFEDEPLDFAIDFLERSFLVAVPTGSTLVTFGHMSHMICLIHRGYCQINSFLTADNPTGVAFPIIYGPGTMFPSISSLSNTPSPITLITVTDCEVLMINLDDFLNILIKYDMFKDVVDVINEGGVADKVKNIKPGLIRFLQNDELDMQKKIHYKETFKKYSLLGKILRLFYAQEGPINLHIIHVWVAVYSSYFAILSVLWPCMYGLFVLESHVLIPLLLIGNAVMSFYVFLQIHNPYFNKDGIKVTHPIYTFGHYLNTRFLVDFFCVFPIYTVYWYGVADSMKKPDSIMVCFNCLLHYFKLIHIIKSIEALEKFFTDKHSVRLFKIIIIILVTINLNVNIALFLCSEWIFSSPYVVKNILIPEKYRAKDIGFLDGSVFDCYLFTTYAIISNLTNTNYFVFDKSTEVSLCCFIQGLLGTVLTYYLFAWISSTSLFANLRGTIYQEKIASFVRHLEFENANDKLIEFAIAHYNNEWSRTHGENLREIFEHLPRHLHEELVYPQYRPTMIKNSVLSKANEGFFKILATHLSPVYFTRGSVIIFQFQVQSDMYFLHRGQCFAYDWFLTLDPGSIIGDIKQTGLMENKIYALTHVELLKISSREFYMIINNFDDLEADFMYAVRKEESFMRSETRRLSFEVHLVDSKDVLNAFGLQTKSISFEDQSYFEDPENTSIQVLRKWKKNKPEEITRTVIYPGTWLMRLFRLTSLTIRFLTFFLIPALKWFGTLTPIAFILVGALDCCWLVIILVTFRVSYVNQVKGDVITNSKLIAKAYMKRWNGLFIDLLALLPFELLPVAASKSFENANPRAVGWLRCFRLLRAITLFLELQRESRRLNINPFLKWWTILTFVILWLYVMVFVFIGTTTYPKIANAKSPHELSLKQFFAFVLALEYVLNTVAVGNVFVFLPTSVAELWFLNFICLFSIFFKGWIISKVLSIFYVKGLATSYYKSNVKTLETYLVNKDTSPAIIKEVLNYKFNLLLFSRSENMPVFLSRAPSSLRMAIMKDLYIHHLQQCPLFIHTPAIFLEQLVSRMTREVYFPGMKVVEQFDVDHRMYFIHKGEVYVINQTKERAYIEMVVGMLRAGMYFGESQGLWFSRPHTFTYRARTVVEILVLRSRDWMDLRRIFPEIAMDIFREAKSLRII